MTTLTAVFVGNLIRYYEFCNGKLNAYAPREHIIRLAANHNSTVTFTFNNVLNYEHISPIYLMNGRNVIGRIGV